MIRSDKGILCFMEEISCQWFGIDVDFLTSHLSSKGEIKPSLPWIWIWFQSSWLLLNICTVEEYFWSRRIEVRIFKCEKMRNLRCTFQKFCHLTWQRFMERGKFKDLFANLFSMTCPGLKGIWVLTETQSLFCKHKKC